MTLIYTRSTTTTTTTTPEVVELRARVEDLNSQMEDLEGDLGEAEAAHDKAQAENAELGAELSGARSENSELRMAASIPLGVEQGYYCFRINLVLKTIPDPASTEELPLPWIPEPGSLGDLIEEFSAQMGAAGIQDRLAGSVLTFGVSPRENTWRGTNNAENFNRWVLPELPMFDLAARRHFWDGSPAPAAGKDDNGFRVAIYLLDDGEGDPPLGLNDKPDCG